MKQSASELEKAGHRLMAQRGQYGGPALCALAWVLHFAQEDLRALGAGGVSDRLEEVKRFSLDAGIGEALAEGDTRDSLLMMNVNVKTDTGPAAIPMSVLLLIQSEVSAILKDYVSGEHGIVVRFSVKYEVRREANQGRIFLHLQDLRDGFLLHLFHLLAELGSRVKPCRYCGTLILAGRMDKKFCSGVCQAMQYKKDHPPKEKHQSSRSKKGEKRHAKK